MDCPYCATPGYDPDSPCCPGAEVKLLRAERDRLRAALGQIAGCDTPGCDACQSEYPEDIARDALDNTTG